MSEVSRKVLEALASWEVTSDFCANNFVVIIALRFYYSSRGESPKFNRDKFEQLLILKNSVVIYLYAPHYSCYYPFPVRIIWFQTQS